MQRYGFIKADNVSHVKFYQLGFELRKLFMFHSLKKDRVRLPL